MSRRRPDEPKLPISFHPLSNGEYAPLPASDLIKEVTSRVMRLADERARRLGMSRRQFLQSAAGMATTLAVLSACSKESGRNGSAPSTSATVGPTTTTDPATTTTIGPGGTFTVPPEATTEVTTATTVLSGDEFVMDVQTHLLEYASGTTDVFGLGFPQASCGDDPVACLGIDAWLDLVLGGSDTAVAVISAVPVIADPDPLSAEVMQRARAAAEALGCSNRVLIQGHATPTLGELPAALDAMAELAATYQLAAWKAYTHEGPAWRLDDDVGNAFCEQVRALGQRIICVHKGLGPRAASPADVGPAAANHPDLAFCAYHSGFETEVTEGPYPGDEAGADAGGVDRLIASARAAGVAPGGNIYAELGSTWWNLIQRPDEAAHVLGKLLVALGPDNILWGTDSIWYGSPQAQIDAFRAFEITPEFQERFGYPALTPDVKARILGLNAARLYGVDPTTTRCPMSPTDRAARRAERPPLAPTGPTTATAAKTQFSADHPWFHPRLVAR